MVLKIYKSQFLSVSMPQLFGGGVMLNAFYPSCSTLRFSNEKNTYYSIGLVICLQNATHCRLQEWCVQQVTNPHLVYPTSFLAQTTPTYVSIVTKSVMGIQIVLMPGKVKLTSVMATIVVRAPRVSTILRLVP